MRNLYLFAILLAAFLSGYFIHTNITNKGILVASQIFISFFALMYFFVNFKFDKKWLILSFLLLTLLILNGSSYGSILLVSVNLILIEIIRKFRLHEKLMHYINYKYLYVLVYAILLISFIDLTIGTKSLWSHDTKFLSLHRLMLLTSEPSHLSLLIAPLIYIVHSVKNKIALSSILFFTQSYLGFIFYALIYFLLQKSAKLIFVLIGLFSVVYLSTLEFTDFFSNSGLVRLVGITLFTNENLDIIRLIFGHGLGSGDNILQSSFNVQGVEQANGFIFSTLYDLGFLGLFLFIYIMGKNYFDYFVLFILLLNFGVGHILIVTILFFTQTLYRQSHLSLKGNMHVS